VTDTEHLAALLRESFNRAMVAESWGQPWSDDDEIADLIAAGVTLAATPAPLDERPPALPPANPSLMSSLDDEVVLWNPEPLEHFPMSSPHDTSDRRCFCGELLECPVATPAPPDAEQEAALMPLPSTLSERDAAQVRLNVAALLRAATPARLLAKVESSDQATPAPPFSPIVITVCPHSVDTRFTHCLLCERAATPAPLDVRQFAEELIAQIGGMMVMQRETKSATESMRGAYSDVLAIISDRLAATPAPLDK